MRRDEARAAPGKTAALVGGRGGGGGEGAAAFATAVPARGVGRPDAAATGPGAPHAAAAAVAAAAAATASDDATAGTTELGNLPFYTYLQGWGRYIEKVS